MAEYTYTGASPRMLFGLAQGVNAWHEPADGNPSQLVDGQTVVIEPGDRLRTAEDYGHAELAPAEPADPPAPTTTRTKPVRK